MDLMLLAPMRLEALALRGAGAPIEQLGMGPSRAAGSARQVVTRHRPRAAAIMGLGGALRPDLAPGDVVVANRVVDDKGHQVAEIPSAPFITGELRRAGLRAHTGTVVTADHIVTGDEREKLGLLADVVDMESAPVAEILAARGTTLSVVRAISDSPDHELWSPAGAAGIARGLFSLRRAAPIMCGWAEALGPRTVVLADPRSFCAGVRRAIESVEQALARFGAPVYVRRQIVHNAHVVGRLEAAGAVFVEELDEVPDGATVVFSAHGVGTAVQQEAELRSMRTVDATCPLVAKVHHEAKRFAAAGRQVVLVGHAGHDEVEGTLGTVPGVRLVSTLEEIDDLDGSKPTAVVTQTTLATDEVAGMMEALDRHFVDLVQPSASDICYASQNRQEAVRAMAPECDLVLVVGSANSSNANRLVEVARRAGVPSHLVDDETEVRLSWLTGRDRVGVTAGASAPEELVQRLVSCLSGLGPVTVAERTAVQENVAFSLPAEVR